MGTLNFKPETLNSLRQFTAGEESAVIFRTTNSGGNVHLDAVQILPAK
ncbi:hypothetical protein [Prosthecobacter sp.]